MPALCRDQLDRIVTERLHALPGASGYRGGPGADAVPDAELLALLRPPPRRFFFSRPPTFDRALLLARLFAHPAVRAVFAEAIAGVPSIDEATHEATGLAVARGHARVELSHLVRTSLERRWFTDMIAACGGEVRRLSFIVDGRLEAVPPAMGAPNPWHDPLLDQALVTARGRTGVVPAVDLLFIAALRAGMLNGLLQDAGLTSEALLFFFVHGCAPPDPMHEPREGLLRVVVHDDDVSPPDAVRAILEEVFELSAEAARVKLSERREVGWAVIGHWDAAEARTRTRDARAGAAKTRSPLRITLRPAS